MCLNKDNKMIYITKHDFVEKLKKHGIAYSLTLDQFLKDEFGIKVVLDPPNGYTLKEYDPNIVLPAMAYINGSWTKTTAPQLWGCVAIAEDPFKGHLRLKLSRLSAKIKELEKQLNEDDC